MAIGIIIGIVLAALTIGCVIVAAVSAYNDNKGTSIFTGILAGIFCIAFILIPFSFHTIDSSEVGVVKHLGKVNEEEKTAGTHFDFWITNTYAKYDTTVQTVDLVFSAYSADAQTMDVAMTLQYQIIADRASDIAIQYGSLTTLQNRITSIATEKAKSELSMDKAMDIIANRAEMSPRVEKVIKEAIGEHYHVNVAAVVLTDITFTEAFELAVEEKMIAEQSKLKAEYENQTKIAQAEAEAKASEEAARGESAANKIKAEAAIEIAKANAQAKLEQTTADAQAKLIQTNADAQAILIQANADAEALNIQTLQVAKMLGLTVMDGETEVVKPDLSESEANLIKSYIEYIKYLNTWDGKLPETLVGENAEIILPTNKQ